MAISQYENEYYGLSGDNKPLGTPLNGRKFTEMDTSKEYRFDAENQQWLQQSPGGGGGGSSTLSGLTDVDISNPTDGQTLVYNATSGKWENGAGGGGFTIVNGTIDAETDEYIIPDMTIADFLELAQPVLIHASSVVDDDDEVIIDNYAMTVSITKTGSDYAAISINTAAGLMSCSGAMNTPLVFTFPH